MSERMEDLERMELELDDVDRELFDTLAQGITKRRLSSAAIFFLESMKPLGWIGSQVMYFFQPIMRLVFSESSRYDRAARLLEKRGSVELLLRRIEDHQVVFAEEQQAQKEAARALKLEQKAAAKAEKEAAAAARKAARNRKGDHQPRA
jgi:hypothetical protein